MIGRQFQGKGYGKRAVREFLDYFKKKHGADRIYISVSLDNAVARKIFQHLHIGGQALDRGAGDVFAFGFRGHNQYLLKLVMLL